MLGFDACMYYLAIFLSMEVHEMCIRDGEELGKDWGKISEDLI